MKNTRVSNQVVGTWTLVNARQVYVSALNASRLEVASEADISLYNRRCKKVMTDCNVILKKGEQSDLTAVREMYIRLRNCMLWLTLMYAKAPNRSLQAKIKTIGKKLTAITELGLTINKKVGLVSV